MFWNIRLCMGLGKLWGIQHISVRCIGSCMLGLGWNQWPKREKNRNDYPAQPLCKLILLVVRWKPVITFRSCISRCLKTVRGRTADMRGHTAYVIKDLPIGLYIVVMISLLFPMWCPLKTLKCFCISVAYAKFGAQVTPRIFGCITVGIGLLFKTMVKVRWYII